MTEWKAKRFWKEARVAPVEDGYAVQLDGRPVRSPLKTLVAMPSRALAEGVAQEWQAQEDVIAPLTMPLTRAVNATLDKVMTQQEEVAAHLAEYGESDLLCYRAAGPDGLVARQQEAWDPVLDWLDRTHGARLAVTQGVIPVPQAANAVTAMQARVGALSPWELTALSEFVTLSGSLVLGLAVIEDHLAADGAWDLSRIDEDWQIAQWGEDEEEAARIAHKRSAFLQARTYLDLFRAG
ncbi:ATP12 family chaperone protein [Jannaschia seohaensis]|uniref:Chaperone required for assembly of F1-ATPase n=1 Tax=Jannaschia seohaensis TaxID=475081 RepID=A0A2Y9ARU2_9RHOB|nr:ATP12 family protein [Jannaschia seohaensis]PWJ18270.1 chaperone required for assembly of F1-ATPase [Jannaschia seohaensis]SSA46795.1 Chaperone required for the assembly of the F1-ATPase [Jannaschia seohaensis]